jgi:xylulokinase
VIADHILAVDLGTSGCKTALVGLDGRVRGWAFAEVPLHILPEGGVEQVPADWWSAFVMSARQVLAETGIAAASIAGVCCSCQGEGTVPVDREGRALSNAILWLDMRGERHIREHSKGLINVSGYDPLRLLRWVRLTGGAPSLSGKDPAAHMLFVRDEFADVYRSTYKFLNVLDYMNLRLTGRFVATYDSILTSWVTDNRDLSRVRYDSGLVEASGIDASKFPEIVPCTEVIGTLRAEAAGELGIPASTRVVAGAVDNSAAAVGSGAVADFAAHLYVGTSSWIGAHVPFKKTDVFASVASLPCAVRGKYLMMAMQSAAGSSLAFLKDRVLYHKDELMREEQVPDVYKLLDRVAERVPAGSRGLLFTPWLFGERTPVSDPNLRAGFFNLSAEHSREDIVRAILEGVALNTRWMVRPVERFLGRQLEEITITGGGGVSDTWCRIFADVLNVRIRQPDEPMQVNALGAAYIGAAGLGLMRIEEAAALTKIRTVYEPRTENRERYDDSFAAFQEIHRRMAPLYRKLNGVGQ